jgi:hypothetical protein
VNAPICFNATSESDTSFGFKNRRVKDALTSTPTTRQWSRQGSFTRERRDPDTCWIGPRACLIDLEKRKLFCLCRESNHTSSEFPLVAGPTRRPIYSGVPKGVGGGGVNKFRSFDKAEPNSQFRGKYIRNNLIRIRGSLICKLSGTPD